MNNRFNSDNTRFLPLSVAVLLLLAGWGITLILSLFVNAPFFPESYSVLAISLTILELVFLIPMLFYLRKKRPDISVFTAFRLKKINKNAWKGIALFSGGIIILSDATDRILGKWIVVPEEYLLMMERYKWSSFPEAILMIFAAVIVASIAEECIFRGTLLQAMEDDFKKPLMSILFSAFFFAMIHALPWYFIQIAILGIILGGMSYLFHSVLPGIFLHSVYNLASLIMLNITQEPAWYVINGQVRNIWIFVAGLLVWAGYYFCSPLFLRTGRERDNNQI